MDGELCFRTSKAGHVPDIEVLSGAGQGSGTYQDADADPAIRVDCRSRRTVSIHAVRTSSTAGLTVWVPHGGREAHGRRQERELWGEGQSSFEESALTAEDGKEQVSSTSYYDN